MLMYHPTISRSLKSRSYIILCVTNMESKIWLRIFRPNDCSSLFFYSISLILCAGFYETEEGDKSLCLTGLEGDFGGPLACKTKDGRSIDRYFAKVTLSITSLWIFTIRTSLVGLLSHASKPKCEANDFTPSVYVRMTNPDVQEFIFETIGNKCLLLHSIYSSTAIFQFMV